MAPGHVEKAVSFLRGVVDREGGHVEVVRTVEDGAHVVTHATGDRRGLLGHGVFFDVMRFEDGSVHEHWTARAQAAPPNESGHTQTDGPTEARPGEDTETNKSLVRAYYQSVHVAGERDQIRRYFHGDDCIRHEPGVRDGVAAFTSDLERLIQNRSIDEIECVLGQRDFVFVSAKGTVDGEPCIYVDLYRVERGKIAERWGFSERSGESQERLLAP